MYVPPAFRDEEQPRLHAAISAARLASLVTASAEGLMATPLPFWLDTSRGEHGVLVGHIARANPQWTLPIQGEALAIFMGPDAYVSPSYYPTKRDTGKVVPTWNYVAVHVYGLISFIHDERQKLDIVDRLTSEHESGRAVPWRVSDAPDDYIRAQLRGIVGVELTITRLEGKRKLSQNRNSSDRNGVISGLQASALEGERKVATIMAEGEQ